jgi:hypothetical protein
VSDERGDADVDVFEQTADVGQVRDADGHWVTLPSIGLLSVEDADRLLRWRPANVVAVVGERNGGKTTLITEIYERFLHGPFADHLFSHSLSLLGFEQKSFQSRAESGVSRPDTQRTSARDGLRFFHLGLSEARSLGRTDLLISERAGEVYRDMRDRPALGPQLEEVVKARTVVFILDGERVSQARRRAEAFASIWSSVRALADGSAIPAHAEVQLVTTKCDLLNGHALSWAEEALREFEERFVGSYSERFAKVSTFRTAARDPSGLVETAWGVAPLLMSWLQPPPLAEISRPPLPALNDEFDMLLVRGNR